MTAIEVRVDLAALEEVQTGDILVEEIGQYLPAYAAVAEALRAGQALRVVVRHRACAAWLRQMQAKYGPERIALQEVTYRGRLSDLWGIDVPAWVSERDLADSKLLELVPLTAKPGESFEDLVLGAFFGPAFTYPQLPLNHIVDLARGYDGEQWQAALARPVVRALYAQRLGRWRAAASAPGVIAIIDALERNPAKLVRLLSEVKVLQGYPADVGVRVMGPGFEQLAALKMDLGGLTVDAQDVRAAADHIEVYLHGAAKAGLSAATVEEALTHMSGELPVEFAWVESCLQSGDVVVDHALLAGIERVFHPMRARVASRLADLALLIEPARPSEPDGAWDAPAWMRWSVKEYLPYRFWLEERHLYDADVASYATMYGDWLHERFPQLLTTDPRLVYRAILNSQGYVHEGNTLLFIIIDNFNHKYVEDLRSLMRAKGYSSSLPDAYISMLPSATIVSKKALATGQPFPFKQSAYKTVVENTWNHYFGPHSTSYLSQIGQLQALASLDHDIYILNYTPIDSVLHSDPQQTGVSHAQAIRQSLANLTDSVHDFALRFGIEAKLQIVVCADHGSTQIAADAPNVVDSKLVSSRVQDAHHRYVALSDEELEQLPQTILDQCYLFKRDVFQLDRHYLAARGYYRFKKTEETCYVHGGLTPEETIVPYLLFERAQVTVKAPAVRLLNDSFRYGVKSEVELEIVNVNELPLQSVRVEILNPNVEAHPSQQAEVPAQDVASITIPDVRIRQATEETTLLEIAVTYECAGEERRDTHSLAVTMKHLMTSSFDFDLEGGS